MKKKKKEPQLEDLENSWSIYATKSKTALCIDKHEAEDHLIKSLWDYMSRNSTTIH